MDRFQLFLMIGISAILWTIYKTILNGQKTLVFNRYFLLGILSLSVTLPFVHFDFLQGNTLATTTMPALAIVKPTVVQEQWDWQDIIKIVYLIVTLLLSLRFLANLFFITRSIQRNQRIKRGQYIFVLLEKAQVPYCFLNYIFVSKRDFEQHEIEAEILTHEKTHAQQFHTLDVLLAELILILFWFNPFFWLVKRSIAANHEFLADDAVLNAAASPVAYKRLIISKVIAPYHNQFASNFNFMLTKKRFLMMSKKISKVKARSLKLTGILLLIGGTILGLMLNARTTDHQPISTKASVVSKTITPIVAKNPTKKSVQFVPLQIKKTDTISRPDQGGSATSRLDQAAEYKGGINLFRNRFQTAFKNKNVQAQGEASAVISFVINTDGSLSDITAVGSNSSFNAESVRAVKMASNDHNWIPGMVDHRPVRSRFRFPIKMDFNNHPSSDNPKGQNPQSAAIEALMNKVQKRSAEAASQHLDKVASFKTGINEFRNRFQQLFKSNKVKGSGSLATIVTFIVQENGSISDIQATGSNRSFNKEAVLAVKAASPGKDWNPAILNGKPVRSLFRFPITMNFP